MLRLPLIAFFCLAFLVGCQMTDDSTSVNRSFASDSFGTHGSMRVHSRDARRPHNFQIIQTGQGPIREGQSAMRFELRNGDCGGADCQSSRERTERAFRGGIRPGQETWNAWSIFIEEFRATPVNGMLLGQFKHEPVGQQVFSVFAQRDGIYISLSRMTDKQLREDPDQPIPESQLQIDRLVVPISRARGRWLDFMVHSNWATDETGFLDVYLNGLRIDSYRGPVAYPDNLGLAMQDVTFRFGIYRSQTERNRASIGALPTYVVTFDNVKQGRTRASVEAPELLATR